MEKKKIKISNFYLFDLIKHLIRSKNWLAVGYLLINVALVAYFPKFMSDLFFEGTTYTSMASVKMVLAYLVIACIAISPIGEWILRFQQGCKKIKDVQILNRLEPLFMEVKETAKRKHPDMVVSDKINLYLVEDNDVNAFALGRNSVCVTTGLLRCSDEQIKGVLAHEFGHLVMHDTDLILLITVGNFMVTALVTFINIIIAVFQFILGIASIFFGKEGIIVSIFNAIIAIFRMLFVNLFMFVWTKLGVLMVMASSRNAEYEADAFACDLGYSEGLVSFLSSLLPMGENAGNNKGKDRLELFAILASSHPKTKKRIERIRSFANQSAK